MLPTGRTSCAPCCLLAVPTHCSAVPAARGCRRSVGSHWSAGTSYVPHPAPVQVHVRRKDARPGPLVAGPGRDRSQADAVRSPGRQLSGTFAGTADQSRSFGGGRRARCRWQVRGCVQYWPTCSCGGGGSPRWGTVVDGFCPRRAGARAKGPLTAMQIRLTVVDPLGPPAPEGDRAASCDVLVTAPAGTALAAVASALAAALPGGEGPGTGQVVLYAGAQRLDAQRSTLGEPPLIDGGRALSGRPRRARPAHRPGRRPGPAARGRRPRRGRRPPAARRADPARPLRRRRHRARRPGRLPDALRGHRRPRRPRLGRRPRLHQRHDAGRRPRGRPPGPPDAGRAAADR